MLHFSSCEVLSEFLPHSACVYEQYLFCLWVFFIKTNTTRRYPGDKVVKNVDLYFRRYAFMFAKGISIISNLLCSRKSTQLYEMLTLA
jgi:hypothetical protein